MGAAKGIGKATVNGAKASIKATQFIAKHHPAAYAARAVMKAADDAIDFIVDQIEDIDFKALMNGVKDIAKLVKQEAIC